MEKMEREGKGEREGNGDREGVTHFQGQRTCPLARNIRPKNWNQGSTSAVLCNVEGDRPNNRGVERVCVCLWIVCVFDQPTKCNYREHSFEFFTASILPCQPEAQNTMMDSKCLLPAEGITFRICKFNGAHEYRIYFKSVTTLFPDFNPQQLLNELISTTAAETFI